MTDERETNAISGEAPRDCHLTEILRKWEDPGVPLGLDARILAAYRDEVKRAPAWKQWLTLRVSVPLPLAVAALLLLLLTASFVIRQELTPDPTVPQVAGSGQDIQTARGPDANVVIQTSLVGFEPVDDVSVLVVEEAAAK